jgi:peptidoglycan hydrolase-like protein with peptidoglycan-binding domain
MRIFAAILVVILGGSVALAQGDVRGYYGPLSGAHKAKSKSKAKAAHKAKPAAKSRAARKHQREQAAKAKGQAKTKANTQTKNDAKSKAAAQPKTKAAAAKPDKNAGGSPAANSDLRQSYAAIPLADRVALQSDLIWTGDYNGLINGEYSDQLVEAVKTYQKRHKDKVTGVPTEKERTALATGARPRQQEVGWQLVEDPVTGARVGLPGKLATKTAPGASGTRWSSAQGQLRIETFQIDTGATLEGVFEQQKKLAKRRVTGSTLKLDHFSISGTQGLKKFHVRAFARDGEVRGITILYDQAMEGTMDPLMTAMSSAYEPFASYTVASTGSIKVARRKVEYGSGVVVSPNGHIVTARRVVDGCHVIAIPTLGNAERLAEDKDGELALLRVYGMRKLAPIALRDGVPSGTAVTLVGIADPQAQGGGSDVTAVPARLVPNAHALEPTPAPGFSGAAALDGQGHLLGIAIQRSSLVAGLGGAAQAATLTPLAKVKAFLAANHVAPAAGQSGVAGAKAATVRVICVRK